MIIIGRYGMEAIISAKSNSSSILQSILVPPPHLISLFVLCFSCASARWMSSSISFTKCLAIPCECCAWGAHAKHIGRRYPVCVLPHVQESWNMPLVCRWIEVLWLRLADGAWASLFCGSGTILWRRRNSHGKQSRDSGQSLCWVWQSLNILHCTSSQCRQILLFDALGRTRLFTSSQRSCRTHTCTAGQLWKAFSSGCMAQTVRSTTFLPRTASVLFSFCEWIISFIVFLVVSLVEQLVVVDSINWNSLERCVSHPLFS